MNAEIDLIGGHPGRLPALAATLTGHEHSRAMASIVRHFLSDADLQGGQGKGRPRRLVGAFHDRDPRAVRDFFGRGEWARGRLMREYTVLLDPGGIRREKTGAARLRSQHRPLPPPRLPRCARASRNAAGRHRAPR